MGFHEAVPMVGHTMAAEVEHIGMDSDEDNIPRAVHVGVHREPEEVLHKDSEVEFEMKGSDGFRNRRAHWQRKLKDLQCWIHLKVDFVQHPYRNGWNSVEV